MTKVFFIGPWSLKKDIGFLTAAKGYSVIKFQSIGGMIYRQDDKPDLIIVSKDQSADPAFKEFAARYKDIPKVVHSSGHSFSGFAPWLRYPQTFPLVDPSPKELEFFIRKAVEERRLIREHAKLKDRFATLSQELTFFDEVSKTLTSSIEVDQILAAIMKKARKLIKAETWSLLLLDEETGDLVSQRGSSSKSKKATKIRLKVGEGIAGWVAQEGIPVVVPDITIDKRFYSKAADREVDFNAKSLMCVPIKSKGSVLGVLEITSKNVSAPFSKDDLDLLMRLVDRAAIAIERASLYQKMAELSITDDLTKLFNTRYLNRTLEIELSRSDRYRSSLSLIFMDIDHFKTINDSYGHLVGSKLLVEIGQLLIKSLRTVDIVARYGGDEFVIVLPQTSPASATQIAERIRRSIERNVFLKKEGYSLRLTASFGVASYPESAKSKEDLLRLADEAMYRVKYQTRNGVYAIV